MGGGGDRDCIATLVFFGLLNVELSPESYWQRPRSKEMGEEG